MGTQWKNGGQVKLLANKQTLNGHIKADSISSVTIKLNQGSTLTGAINPNNTAKKASLTLSKDSIWNVTADSYLTELNNEDSSNSNIHTNGYTVHMVKNKNPIFDITKDFHTRYHQRASYWVSLNLNHRNHYAHRFI